MSMTSTEKELVTWYLEMKSPDNFKSTPFFQPKARVELLSHDQKVDNECLPANAEVNRWFYAQVGKKWQWTDRADWTDDQWGEYVTDDNIVTGVGYLAQDEIGYFELHKQQQGRDVEVAYFGLLPEFVGHGLGAGLLTAAVEAAWSLNPERVWLHTCNLDHPHAMRNYQARGFQLYDTVRKPI